MINTILIFVIYITNLFYSAHTCIERLKRFNKNKITHMDIISEILVYLLYTIIPFVLFILFYITYDKVWFISLTVFMIFIIFICIVCFIENEIDNIDIDVGMILYPTLFDTVAYFLSVYKFFNFDYIRI